MLIIALFLVSKIWKQPKCLVLNEWTKKMGYTYIIEYYSTLKRETMPFVTQQMNLEVTKQNNLGTEK